MKRNSGTNKDKFWVGIYGEKSEVGRKKKKEKTPKKALRRER
jgi:hypothetical protein